MIVKLNGYTINDPAVSGVSLDEDVIGLNLPGVRTSSGSYAGAPGGYVGGQFPGMRSVSLQGKVFGNDVAAHSTIRKAIQSALISSWSPTTNQYLVTMEFTTYAGESYILYGNYLDFDMPIKKNKFESPFKIELLFPDPIIYDNATGTELTAAISKQTAGGYTYPVVYPVVYAAGSAPTTVTNNGNTSVRPRLTLTGNMTNPVITNNTTGEFIGLTITTAPGDVVVIDFKSRTVTLNGGSIFSSRTASSAFWRLVPGNNSISLTTSSGTDSVTGLLYWRSGVMGL